MTYDEHWAEIIFRLICDLMFPFVPDRALPDPDEVSITDELARLWRESHA